MHVGACDPVDRVWAQGGVCWSTPTVIAYASSASSTVNLPAALAGAAGASQLAADAVATTRLQVVAARSRTSSSTGLLSDNRRYRPATGEHEGSSEAWQRT